MWSFRWVAIQTSWSKALVEAMSGGVKPVECPAESSGDGVGAEVAAEGEDCGESLDVVVEGGGFAADVGGLRVGVFGV